jgi:hypothetical protein
VDDKPFVDEHRSQGEIPLLPLCDAMPICVYVQGLPMQGCSDGSLTAKPICGNCGRLSLPEFECPLVSVELITDPSCN